jgi:hypothetical protein
MKRDDLFPSKYIKCADLKGQPRVVQIKSAVLETLKNQQGQEQRKIVLYFVNVKKAMPLNLTNYDSIAGILSSEETNDWAGGQIELYPGTTTLGGKTVDCIRVRKPQALPAPTSAPASDEAPPFADGEFDDSIPW